MWGFKGSFCLQGGKQSKAKKPTVERKRNDKKYSIQKKAGKKREKKKNKTQMDK